MAKINPKNLPGVGVTACYSWECTECDELHILDKLPAAGEELTCEFCGTIHFYEGVCEH